MNPQPAHIYEFGNYRLDMNKRLLLGREDTSRLPGGPSAGSTGWRPVSLTPKAFDTLVCLVEHGGAILGKDELMRAIWPDTAVEENNLNQNISLLRRVLGEDRGEHRYIATVPGRGYQFVAGVKVAAQAAGRAEPSEASIAVLPFLNFSADPANDYFCDGLAEELINALSRLEQLRVVARTSAFFFKGKDADVREIAQKLNVSMVLEGSVQKSGNRLRVAAQLINAADGYHLWAERYDREMEMQDIFAVQDEITLAVVGALKVKLLGQEKSEVLKHHTENTEAHLLYLKGRYYRWKASPEEFMKCRDYFQRAVDLDPGSALLHFGLNSYYSYGSSWGMLPPNENWPKSKAILDKALELDPLLPEAHLALAARLLIRDRNWPAAEKEIKRVIEWRPNFPEIHHFYSVFLTTERRCDEAVAEGRRFLELDPLSVNSRRFVGLYLYCARRYDEAIAQYHEALELEPNNVIVHESLGDTYAVTGSYSEATAAWQKAITLAGDQEMAEALAETYSQVGFDGAVRAVAEKRLRRMDEKTTRGEYVPAIDRARAFVRLGDRAQTFCWLEKACDERNIFSLLLNADPFYDSLRADPHFEQLLGRIGFPATGR